MTKLPEPNWVLCSTDLTWSNWVLAHDQNIVLIKILTLLNFNLLCISMSRGYQ